MNANDVKKILSENDLISLLEDLGAEPQLQGKNIVCKTVCHSGHKHKLIYFSDSYSFKCFTDSCGSMDIYGLVGRVIGTDFYGSFKYVCMKFGISYKTDFKSSDLIETSFFEKFKKKTDEASVKKIDDKVLNSYCNLYHRSWIDDGISIASMKKYGIKFSIMDNQIVIPHYDHEGNLIGVRARNLNEELVEQGKKYMPVYWKHEVLKHPTGSALYGLSANKECIEKYRTLILFESEKSVLQLDTMMPELSIGVCLSGSSLSYRQLELIKQLEVDEVIVALDKEFEEIGSIEEKFYAEKIQNVFIDKLSPYFRTSVIWDQKSLIDLKDSPTDKGIDVFKELMETRIIL